uniref:Protein kinase domain-containing protein n=2 Tax=Bursaphelenchus xylophilus TaxID=6326 RepID=A0A1I7SJV5_BURXY
FVITDLGYAIRIGSERSAFYPIPETATTHIYAKKALKSEDTESLLFMILGMMAPLPWAGIKNIEEVRKIKLECTEEDSIPDEFNTKEARPLGLYTDDLALENVAEMLILYYLAVEPTDDLHLPVRFPNAEFKLAGTFKSYD